MCQYCVNPHCKASVSDYDFKPHKSTREKIFNSTSAVAFLWQGQMVGDNCNCSVVFCLAFLPGVSKMCSSNLIVQAALLLL